MRGLLILALLLIAGFFLLPFIVGFIIFIVCVFAVILLLSRLGLLPGATFRSYRYTVEDRQPRRERPFTEEDRGTGVETPEGWYQDTQEGEIVTLPETALKKDEEPDDENKE